MYSSSQIVMSLAQAVFRCLLKMEAKIQSQDGPCEICNRQRDTRTVPSKYLGFALVISIPPIFWAVTCYLRLVKHYLFVATVERNSRLSSPQK